MDQITVEVREQEDAAIARRAARTMAQRMGMDKYQTGELELSTSELATNLVRYAPGGTITLEHIDNGNRTGIKLTSEDKGPGIADLDLAMTEGYSTSSSMGSGLPGVKRMMDEFSIQSKPGQGTKVVAVKWQRRQIQYIKGD